MSGTEDDTGIFREGGKRFSDRDHAGHVYSGGGGADRFLADDQGSMGFLCGDHGGFHGGGDGGVRQSGAGSDETLEKERGGRMNMSGFFETSVFFGVLITLLSYGIGVWLKKKLKSPLFNPLLIAIVLTILFLLLFRIDYGIYNEGAKYISFLLTPATVCLAVPLYEQFELLKKNCRAVLAGIISGVLTSLCSIFILAGLFRLDHASYVTLLPKSITTAIGMGVSEELGGYVPVTVAVIIVTGVLGNMSAETVCRIFRIHEPVAKGIAIGTASHAVGTAKAMELGQVEGAMSSLSIVVSGILTVIGANIFARFW